MAVDTTWKFREMIEFRDQPAAEVGMEPIVHVNQDGRRRNIGPISHGRRIHTDVMKTEALKQALDESGFDAATVPGIIDEPRRSRSSERQGRAIDHDQAGSMESRKREGYF